MKENHSNKSHWNNHASQWSLIGSPLRPCNEDVQMFTCALIPAGEKGLLLGVTPELANLTSDITAIDNNPAMIEKLRAQKTNVICGDWLEMSFPLASFDFVFGDGSLNAISYPEQYEILLKDIAKIVKKNGLAAFRIYAAPEKAENVEAVVYAAAHGKIGSFHAFKWRFAMALTAKNNNANIKVAAIYREFQELVPDRELFAQQSGFSLAAINTIDVYAGSDTVYSFPTLSQVRAVTEKYITELAVTHGSYELSECCPVVTFRV